MEIQGDYPQKLEGDGNNDGAYWKKGDKYNYFCLAGGNDNYFKA